MKKRFLTSIYIVLATILAVAAKFIPYVGNYIFDIFAMFITFVAGMEICKLLPNVSNKFMVIIYAVINYIAITLSIEVFKLSLGYIYLFSSLTIVLVSIITFIYEAIKNKKYGVKENFVNVLNTIIACCYPVMLFMLIVAVNHMDSIIGINNISVAFIILIFAITMLTDTLAYLVGSTIKGPKLAPKISPKKTISGAVGGLIGGIAGAMLVFLLISKIASWAVILELFNLKWWHFLIIGVLGSVLGQCGDLFESQIKRNAGVKDSGNMFPGHGGMLDRIDAMIFVVCFIYIIICFL